MNDAFTQGIQGIVSAACNIFSGSEFCTSLAYNNHAGLNALPVIYFNPQIFRLRVSSEPCRSGRLGLSHMLNMLSNLKQFVNEKIEELKFYWQEHQERIILFIIVVLISLLSFAVGYITAKLQEKEPLRIETKNIQSEMGI